MHFAHFQLLWLVVTVVPLLIVFLWWSWRRRKRLMLEFVPQRLLAGLTVGFSATVERRRMALIVVATAALLVSLARPQWGLVWEEAVTQGRDILVAVDASRSMLAVDSPPTDRLTRAKLAALDLSHIAKSDRFGLIAFAGSAFLQCPLTLDDVAFSQSVAAIDSDIIPQGGTALAEAIDTAVKAFDKSGDNHRVLVMLTDGEDHEEGVKEAVKRAQKAGIKIFTVGVGTPGGELIRVPDDQGNMEFLRDDQGNVVKSRLNESLLKEIATDTGGFYLALSGARPMETLFKKGIELLPKSEAATKMTRSYREQFYWFVVVAIAGLIAEMFWRGKEAKAAKTRNEAASKPMIAALGAFLLLSCGYATAAPSGALKDFKEGEFGKAQAEYERLLLEREKAGKDRDEKAARLEFNAGASAFKAKDFEKARQHFVMSAGAEDLALQQQSYYNLGNTLYRQGEASQDKEDREVIWEDAVRNLKNAVELDKNDADAKHNLGYVEKRLEKLKKELDEMEKQQQSGQQGQQGAKSGRRNRRDRQQGKQPGQQQPGQGGQGDQDQQGSGRGQQNKGDGGDQKDEKSEAGGGKDKQGEDQNGGQHEGDNGKGSGEDPGERMAMQTGTMTPKQAQQLLEAMKAEERSIIFVPPQPAQKQQPRSFKNW